jgi:hypothetical protein
MLKLLATVTIVFGLALDAHGQVTFFQKKVARALGSKPGIFSSFIYYHINQTLSLNVSLV